MPDQSHHAPRRALPPLEDDADPLDELPPPEDSDDAAPRRALWAPTDDDSPADDAIDPESAGDDFDDDEPTFMRRLATPIPPPAPVLPDPEVPLLPGVGRRFSAADVPDDYDAPLPRRSALSPSATRTMSPIDWTPTTPSELEPDDEAPAAGEPEPAPEAGMDAATAAEPDAAAELEAEGERADEAEPEVAEEAEPEEVEETDPATEVELTDEAEPEPAEEAEPEASDEAEPEASAADDGEESVAVVDVSPDGPAATEAASDDEKRPRGVFVRLVLPILAVVVATGLIVVSVVMTSLNTGQRATPKPLQTVEPESLLLTAKELDPIGPAGSWAAALTQSDDSDALPVAKCQRPGGTTKPKPAWTRVRTLASTGEAPQAALHQVESYPNAEDARKAFNERTAELAACAGTTVHVPRGWTVTGLSDETSLVELVFQDTAPEFHHVAIVRVGSLLNVVDFTRGKEAFDAQTVVTAISSAVSRQCTPASGACPDNPTATAARPLPTPPLGWLTPVDLPRINAGVGTWGGTDVADPKLPGSRCEGLNLAAESGATTLKQRTYILSDDPGAPANFGIDEAIYTFETPEAAVGFAAKLAANIDGCPKRMVTAKVARTSAAENTNPVSWSVSQSIDASNTVTYRVGVVSHGNRVIYLMANPSGSFDFTPETWNGVVDRAAVRAAQTS